LQRRTPTPHPFSLPQQPLKLGLERESGKGVEREKAKKIKRKS